MSGGILQLVARGTEDTFITGSPEITFFKTVYRRHTNYSRGEENIPFNTRLDFGKEGTCKIQKFGDLLHHLFLVITIPEINVKHKWKTNKQNNEKFDKDDYDDVYIIVNNKLDKLNNMSNTYDDIILNLKSNSKSYGNKSTRAFIENKQKYLESQKYIDNILNNLMSNDQHNIIYKFI